MGILAGAMENYSLATGLGRNSSVKNTLVPQSGQGKRNGRMIREKFQVVCMGLESALAGIRGKRMEPRILEPRMDPEVGASFGGNLLATRAEKE
jgi:hypothetical protein